MCGQRVTADPRDPTPDGLTPMRAPRRRGAHARRPWSPRWVGGLALAALLAVSGLPEAAAQEELYVANEDANSITVYVRTANGNVAPLRTISGALTGLDNPASVAVTTTAPIPTLAQWGQLGMAALLLGGGLWTLRRRSTHRLGRRHPLP